MAKKPYCFFYWEKQRLKETTPTENRTKGVRQHRKCKLLKRGGDPDRKHDPKKSRLDEGLTNIYHYGNYELVKITTIRGCDSNYANPD